MNFRTPVLIAAAGLLALSAACGGGGDDDDDDDGGDTDDARSSNDSDDEDDEDRAQFGEGGGGTLTIDGKKYDVELKSCLIKHEASGGLTGWDGTLKGESGSTFAGSGQNEIATAVIQLDEDTGYLAQTELEIDGRNISWKGDAIALPDSKPVKMEFELECDD